MEALCEGIISYGSPIGDPYLETLWYYLCFLGTILEYEDADYETYDDNSHDDKEEYLFLGHRAIVSESRVLIFYECIEYSRKIHFIFWIFALQRVSVQVLLV